MVEFYYPEEIAAFEREFVEAERAAYMETCIEDDEIAERMDAGRKALMARGDNEVGPPTRAPWRTACSTSTSGTARMPAAIDCERPNAVCYVVIAIPPDITAGQLHPRVNGCRLPGWCWAPLLLADGGGHQIRVPQFSTMEILVYRGWWRWCSWASYCACGAIRLHACAHDARGRSAAGVFAMAAWFYALAHLPLATAMTLNYTSSVWWRPSSWAVPCSTAMRAAPGRAAAHGAAGFVACCMALRPFMDAHASFCRSGRVDVGHGCVPGVHAGHRLGKVRRARRTGGVLLCHRHHPGGPGGRGAGRRVHPWRTAPLRDVAWLLPIRPGLAGPVVLTRAFRNGSHLVVPTCSIPALCFASIFSVTLFDEAIPALGWAGIVLIVFSGILATVLHARPARHAGRRSLSPSIIAPSPRCMHMTTYTPHPGSRTQGAAGQRPAADGFDCSFDLPQPTAGEAQLPSLTSLARCTPT